MSKSESPDLKAIFIICALRLTSGCVFVLQVFLASVEQFESWLTNKEAFLSGQALGVRSSCLLL